MAKWDLGCFPVKKPFPHLHDPENGCTEFHTVILSIYKKLKRRKGKDGVLDGAKPGTILIDMSSIAPLASKEVSEKAKGKGVVMLDAKMPLVLDGNFKPGFRIELHIKDMMNVLETAHELGVPVPLSSVILEIMQALKCDGKAKDDHGGIVQFYEMLAKTEVRKR